MLRDVLSSVLGRTAPRPFEVTLGRDSHPAVYTTNGRATHCVVVTGTYDLLEAAPEPRRRQVVLFEQLLAGITGAFQLRVRSRAAAGAATSRQRLAEFLAVDGGPGETYRREVSLVLSDAPPAISRLAGRWEPLQRRVGLRPVGHGASGALLSEAEAAVRALAAMGLGPRLLEGRELDRFLDAELPPSVARGFEPEWEEDPDALRVDAELSRTFLLDTYPGLELEPGWLVQLLDLPAAYDLAVHGFKVPDASALRLLSGRIRALQASRLSDAASQSVGDPVAEAGLPEALGLRREVAGNQQHIFAVGVYMTVHAGAAGALEAASAEVLERAARSMVRLLPATFQMAAGHVATLPLGEDGLGHQRLLPGAVVATLYPWLWDELQQPAGHYVGRRNRGGAPVLIDTFDSDRFSNANVGVFGHSGAGKTYLVKGLLLSDADAGIGGFVIDPEAEYGDVCEAIGGQWVDLALGTGTSINVLDPALAGVGDRDPLGDQVADLTDLLATMCGALGDDDRVDLDIALREVLAVPGRTLAELREVLLRDGLAPRVARSLRRWTEGPLGDLFARPTNVALDAEFVVFSLRDLKEEVLPVAYFLIAQWIWSRVRSRPAPRRLLFDEVGLVFEYPAVRRFLVRLARRIRKYQGSLTLVTQNAGDLLSSDQGLVLATNPSTLFLGAQRQAEAQRLQRAFGLTESQCDFLGSARRGEFLLIAGDRRHRISVRPNPWQVEMAALCETSPATGGRDD